MQTNHSKSHYSTTSKVVTFRDEYARVFGIEAAIVLNQFHYWTDPKRCKNNKEGRYWVYNSLKAWQAQFRSISERTLRRIIKRLEDLNVIITKRFNAWRHDQRKWYTINFEKLAELLKEVSRPTQLSRSKVKNPSPPDSGTEPPSQPKLECLDPQKSAQLSEICASLSSSHASILEENSGNLDVATLAACRCGQSGHLSKDTMNTQKTISPTSKEKNNSQDSAREMIKIWNENIENHSDKVILSYWRKKALTKTLHNQFQNSLQEWNNYCELIAHNTFLMGGGPNQWKVSLDWALKAPNIQKVQEKSYTGQKEIPQKPIIFSRENISGSEDWKNVAALLAERLGTPTFKSWFEESSIKEETSEYPVLCLGSRFKAEWVRNRYGQVIEATVKEIMPRMKRLQFTA